MRFIKRKTNVRQHERQTKNKVADVRNHERKLKDRAVLGAIPLKNLNYKQGKKRFPFMEPRGDIDEDGVINKRDCKPFDEDRQDDEFNFDEELRKVRLRNRREGTYEEQQEARKEHNIEMRKMNKEAREMGYGGGMDQVIKEMKEESLWDKANKGELTPEDMEEHELKSFDRDAEEEE